MLIVAVPPGDARAQADDWPTPAELRERAQSIVSGGRYQDAIDGDRVPFEIPKERQLVSRSSNPRSPRDPTSTSSTNVGGVIMWTLLAILAACLIFFVVNELARRKRRRTQDSATRTVTTLPDGAPIVPDTMPATLKNAQLLASEGRLEDAVHLLLQGAIDYVALLARFVVGDAMTSREVLRGATLDDASHDAFGQLVTSVEVSLFGGETATHDDFARCAAAFQHLHGRLQA